MEWEDDTALQYGRRWGGHKQEPIVSHLTTYLASSIPHAVSEGQTWGLGTGASDEHAVLRLRGKGLKGPECFFLHCCWGF